MQVLRLEQVEILSQHFPVELFSDELLPLVVLVLRLPVVVDVGVEVVELEPLVYELG